MFQPQSNHSDDEQGRHDERRQIGAIGQPDVDGSLIGGGDQQRDDGDPCRCGADQNGDMADLRQQADQAARHHKR